MSPKRLLYIHIWPSGHQFIMRSSLVQAILTVPNLHDNVYQDGKADTTFPYRFGLPIPDD
jgi:hypothetical protein